MNRKYRKRIKAIERAIGAHIDAEVSPGGHLKLTINGNVKVHVAATPSDWRAEKNMIRDIKYAMGQ